MLVGWLVGRLVGWLVGGTLPSIWVRLWLCIHTSIYGIAKHFAELKLVAI